MIDKMLKRTAAMPRSGADTRHMAAPGTLVNLLAFRRFDRHTQGYVAGVFGKAPVLAVSTRSDGDAGRRLKAVFPRRPRRASARGAGMIAAPFTGKLPPLVYFALVGGAGVYEVRVTPIETGIGSRGTTARVA